MLQCDKTRQAFENTEEMYFSRVFSNVRSVLSQCNTRLRLLHLLYDIEVMWRKTIKHAFPMFYTLIKHGFLINQSARRILYIYIYMFIKDITTYSAYSQSHIQSQCILSGPQKWLDQSFKQVKRWGGFNVVR